MMWSKGFQAEETKEAFARARELVMGAGNAAEPFTTYYGTWVGQIQRAEIALARQTAEMFRREAEPGTWPTEASVALRTLGMTRLCQGDLAEASSYLEHALNLGDPEAKFHFGVDPAAGAMIHLASQEYCWARSNRRGRFQTRRQPARGKAVTRQPRR
jgi:hypothetical protein